MEDFENNLNIVIKDIFIGQDIEIKVKDNGKNNFFSSNDYWVVYYEVITTIF